MPPLEDNVSGSSEHKFVNEAQSYTQTGTLTVIKNIQFSRFLCEVCDLRMWLLDVFQVWIKIIFFFQFNGLKYFLEPLEYFLKPY